MSAKFTPGPWEALPCPTRSLRGGPEPIFPNGRWVVLPAGDYERNPIAEVDHADDHHPPTRARAEFDARLIACSPDLYTTGKRVTDAFRALSAATGIIPIRDARVECEQAMLALDAAIEKATEEPAP